MEEEKLCQTEKMLIEMKTEIERRLDMFNAETQDDLIVGIKTAYVEALEIMQKWRKAEQYDLDYDIEERYPIDCVEEEEVPVGKVSNWPF